MKYLKMMAVIGLCAAVLCGCGTTYMYDEKMYYDKDFWTQEASVLNGIDFQEDKGVYRLYDDNKLSCIYLKIQEGQDEKTGRQYSFSYLKNYTDSDVSDGEEPFCNVIMSVGTDSESSTFGGFGFGEMTANAKLTVKGRTDKIDSRSWQIKLYDRAGLYEGARTINLIKNTDDLSRMKIKLGFDIVSCLEDTGGLRTKFVRLFVYDTTDEGRLEWEDMGIYTYVEQPNKAWLNAHGLDENGTLYRAKNFRFEPDKALRPAEDKKYDKEKFEEILGIREAENHDKLLKMIDAVNAPETTIDDLLGLYFNEENLLTYCAVSLLMGNAEGGYKDYLLYSPQNSDTWYFIFDDFRNAFEHPEMSDYGFLLNNKVFRMYLSSEENRRKLDKKIDEIRTVIDDDFVEEKISYYKSEILKYIYSMPEINELPAAAEEVEPYIEKLPEKIAAAEDIDFNLCVPYITGYKREKDKISLEFHENKAYDYTVQISADRRFETIIGEIRLNDKVFSYDMSGSYYIRLTAKAPDGSKAICGNISEDTMGREIFGGIEIEQE